MLFLLLFPSVTFAGATYYVDTTNGSDSNSGNSVDKPWRTVSKVNNYSFATGDDIYFKCGETWSEQLKVRWNGSENDRSIIGAYYIDNGKAVFGVNGNRPQFDGKNNTLPADGSYQGLIHKSSGTGFITLKDLKVNYSGHYGINFTGGLTKINIENCYVYRSKRNAILYGKVKSGLVKNNVIQEACYKTSPNAAITINSANVEGATTDITVQYNKIFNCYEGIGIYKKCTNIIVEYNYLYDNRSYQIYVDAGSKIIIRYNLVYGSAEWRNWKPSNKEWPSYGIVIDCEQKRCDDYPDSYPFGSDNEIYGNLIAYCNTGISLESSCETSAQKNTKIFNNTIVDCGYNLYFKPNQDWSGNLVANNISWIDPESCASF